MANMLTWLFQLLFLPGTLAIANVRKFLHMPGSAPASTSIILKFLNITPCPSACMKIEKVSDEKQWLYSVWPY